MLSLLSMICHGLLKLTPVWEKSCGPFLLAGHKRASIERRNKRPLIRGERCNSDVQPIPKPHILVCRETATRIELYFGNPRMRYYIENRLALLCISTLTSALLLVVSMFSIANGFLCLSIDNAVVHFFNVGSCLGHSFAVLLMVRGNVSIPTINSDWICTMISDG